MELLRSHGYGTFDLLIRRAHPGTGACGGDLVAAERFTGPALPGAWSACEGKPFRANLVAYHFSHFTRTEDARRVDPMNFLCDYQVLKSQELLRTALCEEAEAGEVYRGLRGVFAAGNPVGMGAANGSPARAQLRVDVMAGGWAEFLTGPVGQQLAAKVPWGRQHDRRRAELASSPFGRWLLQSVREPWPGSAVAAGPATSAAGHGGYVRYSGDGAASARLTSVLYDLGRMYEHADGRLPRSVIELGAGYGLGAYGYASASPDVSLYDRGLPRGAGGAALFLNPVPAAPGCGSGHRLRRRLPRHDPARAARARTRGRPGRGPVGQQQAAAAPAAGLRRRRRAIPGVRRPQQLRRRRVDFRSRRLLWPGRRRGVREGRVLGNSSRVPDASTQNLF